ncbi:Sec-independent protein translocase protein TatB [Maricaulaceae bacterium MS644]
MNPGIGAPELLVIAIIALVVVGPKDLPLMVRRLGRFVGKMRGLAREFQNSFDELGREAELAELKKEVEALKKANPLSEIQREFKDAEADAIRAGAEDKPHPRSAKDKPLKGEPLKFGPAAEAGEQDAGKPDSGQHEAEMTGPRADIEPRAKAVSGSEPGANAAASGDTAFAPDLGGLSGSLEDPRPEPSEPKKKTG